MQKRTIKITIALSQREGLGLVDSEEFDDPAAEALAAIGGSLEGAVAIYHLTLELPVPQPVEVRVNTDKIPEPALLIEAVAEPA